jgi:hypothetical protein
MPVTPPSPDTSKQPQAIRYRSGPWFESQKSLVRSVGGERTRTDLQGNQCLFSTMKGGRESRGHGAMPNPRSRTCKNLIGGFEKSLRLSAVDVDNGTFLQPGAGLGIGIPTRIIAGRLLPLNEAASGRTSVASVHDVPSSLGRWFGPARMSVLDLFSSP